MSKVKKYVIEMQEPENCNINCYFFTYTLNDGMFCKLENCKIDHNESLQKRPEWCPLAELEEIRK